MKKQTILFLAGGMLALASCGNNNASQENAQAKVDSMKNAMEMQQKEQAMKDSMTAVMNAQKAKTDSMAGAMQKEEEMKKTSASAKGAHKGHGSEAKTAPQAATNAPQAPAQTTQDAKFNNRGGNNQSKLSPEEQKIQDSKFSNRGK